MQRILDEGQPRPDRTGTGTISLFGPQLEVNLERGFPLLTTKRVHWKSVVGELLWFLTGSDNIQFLHDHGISIWDEWATADGRVGSMYGVQWCRWGRTEINQIKELIQSLKTNPFSRRHVISTWNVESLPDESVSPQENVECGRMALAPCHVLAQFYVDRDGLGLNCKLYQRSADYFLGVPFNIASYALLMHMIANQCGFIPRRFIHSFGDVHIYNNHIEQVKEQLGRTPRDLPSLNVKRTAEDIFSYSFDDFELMNYNPASAIKAPISV